MIYDAPSLDSMMHAQTQNAVIMLRETPQILHRHTHYPRIRSKLTYRSFQINFLVFPHFIVQQSVPNQFVSHYKQRAQKLHNIL
jgi:hypothetical protein